MYLVKLIRHRGEKRIAVSFEKKQELIEGFKKLEGAKWSATLKVWHLPYTEAYCKLFKIKEENTVQTLNSKTSKQIEDFIRWLKSRRYSENTIKTYTEATKVFLNFFANKPLSDIDNNDIIIFNNEYIVKNNLSASYQNQFVNAIKL
ncbi:MAG: site-specific integrase, partial [Bacteroidales bacterium]|nr:site-specific integrase [Bacteroidales bacterium]